MKKVFRLELKGVRQSVKGQKIKGQRLAVHDSTVQHRSEGKSIV